jgi:hypothetical protein
MLKKGLEALLRRDLRPCSSKISRHAPSSVVELELGRVYEGSALAPGQIKVKYKNHNSY